MEQRGCNLLFCCIVGLSLDDGVRDEKVFTKDSERLIESDIATSSYLWSSTRGRSRPCCRTTIPRSTAR
jgi:hypothetical protein